MTQILLLTSQNNEPVAKESNKGTAALVITTTESLRQLIPHTQFVTPGWFSKEFSSQYGFQVIRGKLLANKIVSFSGSFKLLLLLFRCLIWVTVRKHLGISLNGLVNHGLLKEMRQADIILAFVHDTFSDNNTVFTVFDHTMEILTASLLNKRVMVWNSSIGPLKRWLTSRLGRLAFKSVSLITLREEISLTYLQEARINKPRVCVIPDMVFLLEPASEARVREILLKEGVDNSRPLVGICVSGEVPLWQRAQQTRYRNIAGNIYSFLSYFLPDRLLPQMASLAKRTRLYSTQVKQPQFANRKSLAQIIDYLTERFDATVIVVSHVIVPNVQKYKNVSDDRSEAQAVFEMAQSKNKVRVLTGEYTAQEIKGVIGQCDLFIGMKMHACVAAVSQLVPTLAIAYNYKFFGMMQLVGQEKWVCDKTSTAELIPKIDELWECRQRVREELSTKLPIVKEYAFRHAELASELLFSLSKGKKG